MNDFTLSITYFVVIFIVPQSDSMNGLQFPQGQEFSVQFKIQTGSAVRSHYSSMGTGVIYFGKSADA
jgi:hypothetical protein